MSRRHRAEKREIIPDAKFGDTVISKFMNSVMHAGKKSVAEAIVYGALDQVERRARPVREQHVELRNDGDDLLGLLRRQRAVKVLRQS